MHSSFATGLSQLRNHDLRRLLAFNQACYACATLKELSRMAVDQVQPMFDACSSVAWNVATKEGIIVDCYISRELRESGVLETVMDVLNERIPIDHPLVNDTTILEGTEPRPIQILDLTPMSHFRNTPIYQEAYQLMSVGNQMMQLVITDDTHNVALTINRYKGRFCDREVALYAEICATLSRAARFIHSATKGADALLTLSHHCDEKTGVIHVDASNRVESCNTVAETWLAGHWSKAFGKRELPSVLQDSVPRKFSIGHLSLQPTRYPVGPWGKSMIVLRQISTANPILESLTKRQRQILNLSTKGLNNQDIAETLGIAIRTVEKHFEGIYDKLEVNDRVSAILFAKSRG